MAEESVVAFPLQWPDGWARTKNRQRAPYRITGDQARRELERELKLLGARRVIISTNVPLRLDGKPYAGSMGRNYADPGVAVYFQREVKGTSHPQVIACDKFDGVDGNIRAVGLAVEGIRAIQRSGASELLDRAFTGFKALPPIGGTTVITEPNWWDVLGVGPAHPTTLITQCYYDLASKHHPDKGGDAGAMAAINRAFAAFKKERGL